MATFTDIDAIRKEANEISSIIDQETFVNVIRQTLSEFEYQGLNVLSICNEIYKRGGAVGRTTNQIREDILQMVILFLSRGNNTTKMINRTNDSGKTKITNFKTVYGLVDRVGQGGNTVITLSRVAAVFPLITLKILGSKVSIPRAVALNAVDFGGNFPKPMQTVIAAAVFPEGEIGKNLMRALLLYLIEENKLLTPGGGGSDAEILKRVIPFARASYVSSIVAQDRRAIICQGLGILIGIAPNYEISGTITPAINTFNRKYAQEDLSFIN